MIRKAFVMQLNPGQKEEYIRRHRPIWPELDAVLTAHGARNHSIFLDEGSGRLFGYVELASEERWHAVANTEICKRWWTYMKDIMLTNADNSPSTLELAEVFHRG